MLEFSNDYYILLLLWISSKEVLTNHNAERTLSIIYHNENLVYNCK